MASWWRGYIARNARRYGLDPQAVLAVAAQEGLGGGVGDQGSSFGPFQLHVGGALPAGRGRAWAESPAGIDYALQRIAGVARGQHGRQAITSIVSRFERPANVAGEIQGALGAYGRGGGGASAGPGFPAATGSGPAPADLSVPRSNVLSALIGLQGPRSDINPLLAAMHELRQAETTSAPATPGRTPGSATERAPHKGGTSLSFLEPFASRYGLKVTSTTGGKHVAGSYHYQGRAVDFGGSPGHMMALMQYALHHPRQFTEAFYDPAGFYVKNGRVVRGSIGGHSDHVHLAK